MRLQRRCPRLPASRFSPLSPPSAYNHLRRNSNDLPTVRSWGGGNPTEIPQTLAPSAFYRAAFVRYDSGKKQADFDARWAAAGLRGDPGREGVRPRPGADPLATGPSRQLPRKAQAPSPSPNPPRRIPWRCPRLWVPAPRRPSGLEVGLVPVSASRVGTSRGDLAASRRRGGGGTWRPPWSTPLRLPASLKRARGVRVGGRPVGTVRTAPTPRGRAEGTVPPPPPASPPSPRRGAAAAAI